MFDHQRLTHAEFPEGAGRYVPTDFRSVPRAVLLGEIDAGIWHTVDSLLPLDAAGLTTPLNAPDAVALARVISAAVLVATQDNIPGVLLSRAADEGGDLLVAPSAPSPTELPGGEDPPAAPGVSDAGPGGLRRGTGAPDQGVPRAGAAESCDRSPRRRDR
ncbi:YhfZ family protein [Streptomyces sp. NPDC048430]|uniref:YhfZ family protein n=1 Tax=Streptomyces sp. NPDC048430 TaxID=3155388 RepID=UPI0034228ABD